MARFAKGHSGNPSGKPKGAKDKRTELRRLLAPHATVVVKKLVEKAVAGDLAAMRLYLDRVMPPLRPRDAPVPISLVGDTPAAQGRSVFAALAAGDVTLDEANDLLGAVATQAKLLEAEEFQRQMLERMNALEEQVSGGKPLLRRQPA